MSETGDYVSPEEYWSVRKAYETGVRERMAGKPLSVTDSLVPGDAEYDARVAAGRAAYDAAHGIEPEWDEFYFDPDDPYGSYKY